MQTGRMTIGVELFADHFFVEARIERAEPGEISFLLNADLALEGAASGGAAVELADEGPVRREFQPPLRAWRAPGERTELTLRYSGGAAVDVEKHGWNNGICAEMACLNFYSAYVPQELPFALAQDPRPAPRRALAWSRAATTRRGTSGPTAARALIPSTSSPTAGRRCKSCRGRT